MGRASAKHARQRNHYKLRGPERRLRVSQVPQKTIHAGLLQKPSLHPKLESEYRLRLH